MNHGSLVSLSNSFSANAMGSDNKKENGLEDKTGEQPKWMGFKNDNNSGTFIEELNNILKEIN